MHLAMNSYQWPIPRPRNLLYYTNEKFIINVHNYLPEPFTSIMVTILPLYGSLIFISFMNLFTKKCSLIYLSLHLLRTKNG